MHNKTKYKIIYKSIFNEADRTTARYFMMCLQFRQEETKRDIIEYNTRNENGHLLQRSGVGGPGSLTLRFQV